MNQQCKVCGEPAAGFHFGAFTCEGCKSFFGRTYNNLSSISECKNNGECVINKKNRTACKACRLRKCLVVGMSKSGSRYGRRSNWFKIHCLLQEQQQQQQQQQHQQHQQQHQNQQQHQSQQKSSATNNNNNNNNNTLTSNNNATNSNESSNNSASSPGLSISNGFLPGSFLSNLCNNNNNNNNVINNNNNNNTTTGKKGALKRENTPSDSGASSADPDDRGGGAGGGGRGRDDGNPFKDEEMREVKVEPPKISHSPSPVNNHPPPPPPHQPPAIPDPFRPLLLERMSPYPFPPGIPPSPATGGSPFSFPLAFALPPVSLALLPCPGKRAGEQSEPIDLSMKSSKSSSRWSTASSSSCSESPLRIDTRSPAGLLLVDPDGGSLSPSAALPKTVPLDLSTFVRSKALSG